MAGQIEASRQRHYASCFAVGAATDSPGGGEHEFFAPAGVVGLVVALVCGSPVQPGECPRLRRGDRVRVPNRTGAYDKTFVSGPPILGLDGRWWVTVTGRDLPVAVGTLLRATGGDQ